MSVETRTVIERLQAYRASLISDAVTGKIDVRQMAGAKPRPTGDEDMMARRGSVFAQTQTTEV